MGYRNNDRCLDKVADDEPIFVLRAQDRLAMGVIHRWLEAAKATLTPDHYEEARTCLDDFAHWQSVNPGKVKYPD